MWEKKQDEGKERRKSRRLCCTFHKVLVARTVWIRTYDEATAAWRRVRHTRLSWAPTKAMSEYIGCGSLNNRPNSEAQRAEEGMGGKGVHVKRPHWPLVDVQVTMGERSPKDNIRLFDPLQFPRRQSIFNPPRRNA